MTGLRLSDGGWIDITKLLSCTSLADNVTTNWEILLVTPGLERNER